MSVVTVAKKDFRDAIRSRTLFGLAVVFTVFTSGFVYIYSNVPSLITGGPVPSQDTFANLAIALTGGVYIVVPVIGLVVGYKSLAGERTSGSIKFLLSHPHSRGDIVLGKLLGRTAVVTVAVIAGFAVAAVVAGLEYPSFSAGKYLLFVSVTVLLSVTLTSVSIGFSASIPSTSRALYGVIALFVSFLLWGFVSDALQYVANGFATSGTGTPPWARLFEMTSPLTAYQYALGAVLPDVRSVTASTSGGPFFVQHWFGFVILVCWIVVAIGIGLRRFRNTDL